MCIFIKTKKETPMQEARSHRVSENELSCVDNASYPKPATWG